MTNADQFPKTHLHLRNVLYAQECFYHLLNDVFIHSHHHHHHHMSVMELGHLLTCSGLTYLEVSSEVCHDSFCQLGNSVSLSWVVCHEAFCLHVISSSSCIPVVCLEPVLFLIPLQCVNLFCNLSKCILLFSHIFHLCCCYSPGIPCFNSPCFTAI
jgi:hypothetical protein